MIKASMMRPFPRMRNAFIFSIPSLYRTASETAKISTKYINHVPLPKRLDNKTNKSIISLIKNDNTLCKIKSNDDGEDCQYFFSYLLGSDAKIDCI